MRRAGWLAAASLLAVVCLPASAAEGKQLFNGRDLSGWKMTGWGSFAVEDGQMKTVGGRCFGKLCSRLLSAPRVTCRYTD